MTANIAGYETQCIYDEQLEVNIQAHNNLDKAVMELYGYPSYMTEPEMVADLMVRYQKLVKAESANSRKSKNKG